MVNKKGFMRVVEATIAVILILTTLVFLSAQQQVPVREDLSSFLPPILDEVARNLTIREKVANGVNKVEVEMDVENALKQRLKNPTLNVSVRLCGAEEICFLEPYPDIDEDIYSVERVLSGSVKNKSLAMKKLKIFMWRNNF